MAEAKNVILRTLLERLYAAVLQGPCLNCRPHSSRQRVDLTAFNALAHTLPAEILPKLLLGSKPIELLAKTPEFRSPLPAEEWTDDQRRAKAASDQQTRLLERLRGLAEDAFDYEQSTGENALYIGYPLISVTPGSPVLGDSAGRVLAPVALVAVDLTLRRGATHSVVLAAKGSGVDLVVPNFPLLAWLEQQTGRDTSELFADDDGTQPFQEIDAIVRLLAESLQVAPPPQSGPRTPLEPVPSADRLAPGISFLNAAVLGLFPLSNQGLLRDMRALIEESELSGPIARFLSAQSSPEPDRTHEPQPPPRRARVFAEEKLVSAADPCQARATRLAKESPVLVIHGPPGTGKSQTIANIIGDHLSRGERVLMVCDKRTALDVVYNRLTHLGLGDLCAIVHDPQRDQRPLYLKIRDYLDTLVDRQPNAAATADLAAVDEELQRLHLELTGCFHALSEPPRPGSPTFHDLVGEWLSLADAPRYALEECHVGRADLAGFEQARTPLLETLDRGVKSDYPRNPWTRAAGIELGEWLARPAAEHAERFRKLVPLARTLDETPGTDLPPLEPNDLPAQSAARKEVAALLRRLETVANPELRVAWYGKSAAAATLELTALKGLDDYVREIQSTPLDPALAVQLAGTQTPLAELNTLCGALVDYNRISSTWHAFLHLKKRAAAEAIARRFGLHISPEVGLRLTRFLRGLQARKLCQDWLATHRVQESAVSLSDAELLETLRKFGATLEIVLELKRKAAGPVESIIVAALAGSVAAAAEKLETSAIRADRLHRFLTAMNADPLFAADWLREAAAGWGRGEAAGPLLDALGARLPSVEGILRLRVAHRQLPEGFRPVADVLLGQSAEAGAGLKALRRALLNQEIAARIRSSPFLQQVDRERMDRCFARYRELEQKKQGLVREVVLGHWIGVQRARLLAGTGTQLNSLGASLKRRLITRGERAMKLRQVIHQGANGADPLFDVCPVWMASPGTVAQIFPRQPLFDLIVFDEASQCRLEEALPVLLRGRRVVIAGDPKQLPPTRFFESAVVESEAVSAESEQELFERQQAETEDLLGAALNTAVQQSYLDVHYRSLDEALIGFSNANFYQNRLQPIPCPPGRRKSVALRLVRADGTYEERGNRKEAESVCDIVERLLDAPEPPSIGIGCFNLTQRDLILDTLDNRADANPEFRARLEAARKRTGAGSFEGLFVKNLESVQGDERDHMILSTTFGLDKNGKFRRAFGPLSQAGGGRRLNVLVTRAREMVHVVTSIPASEYRALPPLEENRLPNGRWLLYAYLAYIEALEREASEQHSRQAEGRERPTATVDSTGHSSPVSARVAQALADRHSLSSRGPWGTPGFCIDLLVHPPNRLAEAIGVLCDMARFPQAADPVEWELFRTATLERQGWQFHRLWSPALYADPARQMKELAAIFDHRYPATPAD